MLTKEALVSKLGIQSYCFRRFNSTCQIVELCEEIGVKAIELCNVHIDVNNSKEDVKLYRQNNIAISSYGCHGFGNNEELDKKVMEFAVANNIKAVSSTFAIDKLPYVEELSAQYNVKLAIHNHGRHHALGSVFALENIFSKASKNIGLCLDTAWMLDSGEDPVAIAEKFADRLYGMHLKDFIFDRAGKPEDVIVGLGNLNLPKLLDFLVSIDYSGYLTLEYEGNPDNPVDALKKCVEKIKQA
jgi:sugar phosphate isomerase/epimerase